MQHCAGGLPAAALLSSANGDLWALLSRQVSLHWVPSHLDVEGAAAAGVSEVDRLGNEAADIACSTLARACSPAAAVIAARQASAEAIDVVHQVLAAVEEAALAIHHAPGSAIHRRKKAKRRTPLTRRIFSGKPKPCPLPLLAPGGPPLVHQVCIDPGPLPPGAGASSSVPWRATC
jgi:hypothetical protein